MYMHVNYICIVEMHLFFIGRMYAFTDLLSSLQSTYNSKLHNYEFLVCFSNVNIRCSYYEVSFHMPGKILNIKLV